MFNASTLNLDFKAFRAFYLQREEKKSLCVLSSNSMKKFIQLMDAYFWST